jgi:hypothetical protein
VGGDVITVAMVGTSLKAVQIGRAVPARCPECDDDDAVAARFALVDFDALRVRSTIAVLSCRAHGPILVVHGPPPR